jgi:hypothetical protein
MSDLVINFGKRVHGAVDLEQLHSECESLDGIVLIFEEFM